MYVQVEKQARMTSLSGRVKSLVTSSVWLKPVLRTITDVRCRVWDVVHGVDTCGEIPLVKFDFQNKNKTPGLEYQSHHPKIIRAGIMALTIRHEDYTFVDFGCGKGRVLLVASEFPFRKIIGVEFVPPLAETAMQNLKRYRSSDAKCSAIEVVTGDAVEYELPPGPLLLYFFSPFSRPVMEQIVQNLERSIQVSPRDLLVLFTGVPAVRDSAFGSRPQYERLQRGRYIDIYRHRSSLAALITPDSRDGASTGSV
jgi:SAM-dependent methyltransferase